MRPLLVCSLEPGAGKTALCVGLARRFWKDGLRVGYLKTVGAGGASDGDASFVKDVLDLPYPLSTLAPVGAHSHAASPVQRLKHAYAHVASHSDMVVLEAGENLTAGTHLGLGAPDVATALEGGALLVLRYRAEMLDLAEAAARTFGDRLIGVVINAVTPSQMARARESVAPALEAEGVRVLGVVPQDRVLLAVTVREMAKRLKARIICGEEGLDELVERLMIGAMSVDGASVYFRKHPNKAVITGGDRPDVQLAALATPTRCLVLTGGFAVDPRVVARAKVTGVPVLVTERDTLSAVEAANELFHSSRFAQKAKLARLESLVSDNVDSAAVRALLEAAV